MADDMGVNAGFKESHLTSIRVDELSLQRAMRDQGADWYNLVVERCPYLFAVAPVCIYDEQLQQMRAVIAAVEEVVKLPRWSNLSDSAHDKTKGVFYGYDFHVNSDGVHLIEINTNAGGAFLNALLVDSQRDAGLVGKEAFLGNLQHAFVAMFRNEWQLVNGDAPLNSIAIVDESPTEQYLYPDVLLAKELFEKVGIRTYIVDPAALKVSKHGLYMGEQKIDLIYNRLTDFSLQTFPHILAAWENEQIVLTPNPNHYQRYADKNRLVQLSNSDFLTDIGVSPSNINILLQGVPETKPVNDKDAEQWRAERKRWFFKPMNGYGSKGTYRGANVTHRIFGEIVKGGYVAQRMAVPGKCLVSVEEGDDPEPFKFDVRCYVYDGDIQLVVGRLYQGQMTNSRTPGGGFAVVRLLK
jgi:hypothetical protein